MWRVMIELNILGQADNARSDLLSLGVGKYDGRKIVVKYWAFTFKEN